MVTLDPSGLKDGAPDRRKAQLPGKVAMMTMAKAMRVRARAPVVSQKNQIQVTGHPPF